MDAKLEKLIEKLRKEGVEAARKEADAVLEKARREAAAIKTAAEKEAEAIKEAAGREADRFRENSERAIQQAGRDAELKLKEQLFILFDRVFKREVGEALEKDFLQEIIRKVIEQWSADGDFQITLSKKDTEGMEKALLAGLKKDLKKGIDIDAGATIGKGFHIGLKGRDLYYDFSDESIAALLKSFLNKRLNDILE
ncbi:hypothetical protein JXO52_03940 [bacterium]|nr:hypothetical protein [bacterium]